MEVNSAGTSYYLLYSFLCRRCGTKGRKDNKRRHHLLKDSNPTGDQGQEHVFVLLEHGGKSTWAVLMTALGRVGRTLFRTDTSVSTDSSSNLTSTLGASTPNLKSPCNILQVTLWNFTKTTWSHYLALWSRMRDRSSSCSSYVIGALSDPSIASLFMFLSVCGARRAYLLPWRNLTRSSEEGRGRRGLYRMQASFEARGL